MNIIPIIMPVNTTHTVDCITSSGKTYCEKSDIPKDVVGIVIISLVIWCTILFYLLFKFTDGDVPGWMPSGYVIVSFILLGLSFIFL